MSMRRLAEKQPDSFAFSDDNRAWVAKEIAKYPEGRQASTVIALLWKAQEQEGWVSEPAIETVAEILDMAKIRVLEIATFYTMFQLAPVGRVAHVQVCGTTPCWLRGADDIKAVCRRRIAHETHTLSEDGAFSWEEVECLGACVNAPMVQIDRDYYEDLTAELFEKLLDDMAAGKPVKAGPQIDRQFSAPVGGPTTLTADPTIRNGAKAPTSRAPGAEGGDVAVLTQPAKTETKAAAPAVETKPVEPTGADADKPETLTAARGGEPDDLTRINGIGPNIVSILHELGIFHFDQIAAWDARQVAWVDERLKFKGRIDREKWIEQAKALVASGGSDG